MVNDLRSALAALEAHRPSSLLGLRETQWLDAKKAPYRVADDPKAVEELTKDVAAFANGGGGVIVVGIATRLDHDEEVLDHVVGVDPAAVNVDQIRKLIRQRVSPAPRGVRVGWSGTDGERVLFIEIPAQSDHALFAVPAAVGRPGAPRPDTVAVPMRDGDSTYWLPRAEIVQLLSAGVRATGMPTGQALADLVRQAMSEAEPDSGPRVGQGLADREREMRAAYEELAAAGLGKPAGEAWAQGAAALQDVQHKVDGEPGWVLCLVPGLPSVVVAEPVWQAIIEAGRRAPGGQDPLAAVGFPRPPAGTDASWAIPADARRVDLDGGSWGPGHLTRSGRGVWRWQPAYRFSLNQGRSAEIGTGGQTPALRLRALVNLPWAEANTLEINRSRRRQLEQQLPHSAVAGAVTLLSRRRGAELPAARWERGPFGNSGRSASYRCTIAGPDGTPAVTASVLLALPTTMEPTVVACADVLIENPDAWAAALGPGRDTQLGLDELQAVLLAAWETAAELLPDVAGSPATLTWAAPPTTELRITSERPADNGVLPALAPLVDLGPFGPNDNGCGPKLAVTVTAAPAMDRAERQHLLREALVHMAHAFGYVDAETDVL
ncbi:putative DNA binding domain-containing protein [Streptomyces sp. 372A]